MGVTQSEEANALRQYTIESEMAADVVFTGRLIAKVSSRKGAHVSRWTELEGYITEAGVYIAVERGITLIDNERDKAVAQICADRGEFVRAFGYGWLAKKLYKAMGLDVARAVA